MRRSWILPWLGGFAALACVAPLHAQADPTTEQSEREARVAEVQNSFSGPTGGIRIIDASSGPKGTFRLALNTEFFIINDYFVPTDKAHHFAGNLSLSITPTEYLEVFAAAAVTSAWDDSNDPMLIQRVADVLLGLKGFYQAKPWVAVGGDASVAFLGGVGDASATFRATSFGFRGNVTLDFRDYERREVPLIARFNAQYWFDNSANLTEGIEDNRYAALGGIVPRSLETRHFLTAFEQFAYGVNRVDHVRLATGLEAPLKARNVGLHPMLEWQWDIPVNRQGYQCVAAASSTDDGCLADRKLKAFPMLLTFGLRILTPPKGLVFTVAADVGLTGTRGEFVRELAPTVPYNVILGIAFAFDPRPARPVVPVSDPVPGTPVPTTAEVRGRILEQGGEQPIADAVVAVVGDDASPQVTDSSGRFVTYGLPEGEVVLEVSHPDYVTAQCSTPVPSEMTCALVPSSRDGRLRILAVDRAGDPVPQIAITVRGPSEHRLISKHVVVPRLGNRLRDLPLELAVHHVPDLVAIGERLRHGGLDDSIQLGLGVVLLGQQRVLEREPRQPAVAPQLQLIHPDEPPAFPRAARTPRGLPPRGRRRVRAARRAREPSSRGRGGPAPGAPWRSSAGRATG